MSKGKYEWSVYKRRYFLNGKEIFVEKHIIRTNDEKKESIHEIFTIKREDEKDEKTT